MDLFATEPFAFEEEYSRVAVHESAPGVELRIVRLETLLRMKEQTGRPQDLADVSELRLLHEDDDD